MLGLEAQLRDWKAQTPTSIAQLRPVLLGDLFVEIFVYCAPLLKFPPPNEFVDTLAPDPQRVPLAVPLLRRYYEEAMSVDLREFSAFDWSRLVVCVILGIRLSFPIKGFHGWDYAGARAELKFAEFLDAVSGGGEAQMSDERNTGMMDIRKASGVIFDVVRKKYHDRLERDQMLEDTVWSTCPVLDGSIDGYLETWDDSLGMADPSNVSMGMPGGTFAPETWGANWRNLPVGQGHGEPGPWVYPDLWATMTMSWAETEVDQPSAHL